MDFPTVWFWRGGRLSDQWFEVARFTSDRWPHPTRVIAETMPEDDSVVTTTFLDEQGHLVVDASREDWSAGAPPLWYVLVPEEGITKTYTLVAYADGLFAAGTIVNAAEMKERQIPFTGFVGAIRWRRESALMEQIHVPPEHRRKKISTKLISVADTLVVAMGTNAFLNGGEATTADGEKLREAYSKSNRVHNRQISIE